MVKTQTKLLFATKFTFNTNIVNIKTDWLNTVIIKKLAKILIVKTKKKRKTLRQRNLRLYNLVSLK